MDKKKGPPFEDKTNFFESFIKNVKNPIFGFLTISLKGFCIKTARDNNLKPFTLNTTTNAKKEIMLNHFNPRKNKTA